jgi:hypothetical protein
MLRIVALQSAGQVADGRQLARCVRAGPRDNDLVGIGVHDEIGVRRDYDHLPLLLASRNRPTRASKIDLG